MKNIIANIVKGGGKTTSFLLAAGLTFAAAQTAQAANYFWTGATNDGNFNSKNNWIVYKSDSAGTAASKPPTTYSSNGGNNAFFFPTCYSYTSYNSNFSSRGYVVNFYGAVTNSQRVLFKNTGAPDTPIVLRANDGSSAKGLTVGNTGNDPGGWVFSDNGGDSYVRFESGTYNTSTKGGWRLGGNTTKGNITVWTNATLNSATSFEVKNGTVVVEGGRLTANQIFLGGVSGGTATMTVNSGTVSNTVDGALYVGYASGATGNLYLNGGTVVARNLYAQDGTGTVVFNGGTLRAKSEYLDYGGLIGNANNLSVYVTSNGGIIDTDGKTVAISRPLLGDAASSGGGMAFKGGNTVTLVSGNTYTGSTTVEIGTTVHVPTPTDICGPVNASVPANVPADGVYTLVVIDGDGTFNESVLTGVIPPANATLRLSVDAKSVLCIYGNPPNTWVGGASGSLNDNANWSLVTVPAVGESCVIGNATAANLTNPSGSAFAPSVITFPADTALVTISGEGVISGITAITNNASRHHVFNCPVVCADNIAPDITRGSGNYMTFAGGITMFDAPKTGSSTVDYWSGNVTVTTESAQEYKLGGNHGELVAGTKFTFDNGMIDHMGIEPGATAVVERLVYDGCARSSSSGFFSFVFDNGNGIVKAKEIKATGDAVLFHSWAGGDQQCGTIVAEKLVSGTTSNPASGWSYPLFFLNGGQTTGTGLAGNDANGEGVWVIGHGGLSFGSDAYDRSFYGVHLGKTLSNGRPAATLHSYEDWALDVHPLGANMRSLEISSGHGELLVIDTSHYAVGDPTLDAATSHIVTLNGKVQGGGAMRVEGNGKVIFANANNAFSGGLTVADTATVEVKSGCKPGNGAVTVHGGATLQVTESGTVTLGGNLTLEDGATLAFNFTQKATAPTLEVSGVSAAGTVKVKVSASTDIVRPKGGATPYTLTTGGGFGDATLTLVDKPDWVQGIDKDSDGNIVLTVKPLMTMILVK